MLPPKASPEFNTPAQIPEYFRLQMAIDRIGDPKVSGEFDKLKKRQSRRVETLKITLEDRRKKSVETMALGRMDEAVKEINARLRPTDLPTVDQKELYRCAVHDATAKFNGIVTARVLKAERGSLREQKRFVEKAISGLSREHFNGNSRS